MLPICSMGGESAAAFANLFTAFLTKKKRLKMSKRQTDSSHSIYGEKPVTHLPLIIPGKCRLNLTISY